MIQIDQELKLLIPPLSEEEYSQLEQNMINEKNSDSIVLFTWNGILIDGHNRYDICQKHNIKFTVAEKNNFADKDEVKEWIIKNQFGRRNINNYVRSRLALELECIYHDRAKANIIAGAQKTNKDILRENNKSAPQISAKPIQPIETRQELAKAARVSHDTIAKVKKIEEKATTEIKRELELGTKSINEVYKDIKKEERHEEKVQQQLMPKKELPTNEYDIIIADPPWRYDFSSTENREIENQYPTMEIEDICKLKVPAASHCVLFLWATAPKLKEALRVIESWGFEYKTHAIWDKQKIGMGYYFRGQHELLLVATKGNPGTPLPETRPSSMISSPRTAHSKKPDIVYELIEEMYPNKHYLELFARNVRAGWESWGNEV